MTKSHWPRQPESDTHVSTDVLEVKRDPIIYSTRTSRNEPDVLSMLFEYFSSWYRLRKAVARILHMKAILLHRIRKGQGISEPSQPITVDELTSAERAIVRHVQYTSFDDATLKSRCFQKLSPSTSDQGLIEVGGRLAYACVAENVKHPWILPKQHPVVSLIIRHYHEVTGHSGAERTLAEIRQRFWIIKGCTSVKRMIHGCIPCKRRKAPTLTQRMSDLLADCVTPGLPPFIFAGVDIFGLFLVKWAGSEVNRYGSLFTCLSIRAIHLEGDILYLS